MEKKITKWLKFPVLKNIWDRAFSIAKFKNPALSKTPETLEFILTDYVKQNEKQI